MEKLSLSETKTVVWYNEHMRDQNICWYCENKPRKNKKALFCKDCERIEKKEVNRSQLENYYMKV